MDLLKALKRITCASAAGLLALGATASWAADETAVLGHISASVQGTLSVKEISAVNFGNFSTDGNCGTTAPAAGTAGADYIVLSNKGARTTAGCFTLMYGAAQSGLDNTNTHFETGGQSPGFYSITGAINNSNVYVSFANVAGAIVDSQYGSFGTGATVYTHGNNYVTMTGNTASAFAVNEFTFETDDTSAAGPNNSGYTQLDDADWDATYNSGNYVTLTGTTARLRVGAKLTPLAAAPAAGKYTASFYVMVSY